MLLEQDRLVGIITDRDLRSRCVAQGLSPEHPARSIMTSRLQTIQQDTLLLDALMTMTRLHVHHLPVLDGERVVGMLTASDLARLQTANPAFITADIRKSGIWTELISRLQTPAGTPIPVGQLGGQRPAYR